MASLQDHLQHRIVYPHPYRELQRQPLHRPVQGQQLLAQLLAVRTACSKGWRKV